MSIQDYKTDERPKRGWWAPGGYYNTCRICSAQFIGDKRAGWCADCAYAKTDEELNPQPSAPFRTMSAEEAELRRSLAAHREALRVATDALEHARGMQMHSARPIIKTALAHIQSLLKTPQPESKQL